MEEGGPKLTTGTPFFPFYLEMKNRIPWVDTVFS